MQRIFEIALDALSESRHQPATSGTPAHLYIRKAVVRPIWIRVRVACMPETSAGQHIPHLQSAAHKGQDPLETYL